MFWAWALLVSTSLLGFGAGHPVNHTHHHNLPRGLTARELLSPYFYRQIVAIGDLHGDWDQTLKVLRAAGVITLDNHWDPDNGIDYLVQLGDLTGKSANLLCLCSLLRNTRSRKRRNTDNPTVRSASEGGSSEHDHLAVWEPRANESIW